MAQHVIHQNVTVGKNPAIGWGAELGVPPRGLKEGESELTIGDNATIRSHSVLYAGSKIGNNFTTGHGAVIQTNVVIGDNVSIGSGTEIEHDVTVGNNVRIHSQCFIAEGTVIEDNVKIAPGVHAASDRHPLIPADQKKRKGPRIREGTYIGMGVTLLPGIVIGKGSLIAAGSVVARGVPDEVVVMGNPARVYLSVKKYLAKLGF